jgi:hypothetical protein
MNSTNNNSFEIAAKKVFSDLYALIKEDENETEYKIDNKKTDNKTVISNKIDNKKTDNKTVISNKIDNNKKDNKTVISNKINNNKKDNKNVISNKIDDKNVISNEIDDKPKPFNLLDLDNDILNIIGDFVKKDNEEREEEIVNSEQTINGKIIMFRNFCGDYITKPLNTKEDIKNYIFDYIDREFPDIKTYASNHRIRLSKDDKRRCAWVLFKRCKYIFNGNKLVHNKVIYNMDDEEEKEIFEEYLKLKKLNSPQKFEY